MQNEGNYAVYQGTTKMVSHPTDSCLLIRAKHYNISLYLDKFGGFAPPRPLSELCLTYTPVPMSLHETSILLANLTTR